MGPHPPHLHEQRRGAHESAERQRLHARVGREAEAVKQRGPVLLLKHFTGDHLQQREGSAQVAEPRGHLLDQRGRTARGCAWIDRQIDR